MSKLNLGSTLDNFLLEEYVSIALELYLESLVSEIEVVKLLTDEEGK